jgi:LDH2 family malate/lactate/ureidoglycolate dehydrogenase
MNDATRHTADALTHYARSLLQHAGLDEDKAADVAAILVEGDLLGHDTHGLALLAGYLGELDKGSMGKTGSYATVQARGAAQTWDGQRLPGPWLVLRAMEAATAMAREHGTGTVVIRRSHHIACLAAYLRRATEQGLVMELICSDPNSASVAPFGGTRAVFTPNPLAIGFPTGGEPVLVDVSASLTTNGMTARLHRQGRRLEHAWLLDANGAETNDPSVLFASPPGTLQPLGGTQAGHKGYGLALWVEALTGGLAGHGRADPKEGWGATVYLQIIDPQAFAGVDAFTRQMQHIAQACSDNPPRTDGPPVRLPGTNGLRKRAARLRDGIALHPEILPALQPWGERYGVALS